MHVVGASEGYSVLWPVVTVAPPERCCVTQQQASRQTEVEFH